MSRLEERQAAMRERFKSDLPKRIRDKGTVCSECRTPFVVNPESQEVPDLCGWCKARAKRQAIQ
jgi:hypothetical protein